MKKILSLFLLLFAISLSASAAQCAATTKAGTRCSRNAKVGNYCTQHSKRYGSQSATTTTKKQTSSGQCEATTKKGARCKNKAKKGSKFCGVHSK